MIEWHRRIFLNNFKRLYVPMAETTTGLEPWILKDLVSLTLCITRRVGRGQEQIGWASLAYNVLPQGWDAGKNKLVGSVGLTFS